jgi:hypothetical protein
MWPPAQPGASPGSSSSGRKGSPLIQPILNKNSSYIFQKHKEINARVEMAVQAEQM